jgi:hypothetical protein
LKLNLSATNLCTEHIYKSSKFVMFAGYSLAKKLTSKQVAISISEFPLSLCIQVNLTSLIGVYTLYNSSLVYPTCLGLKGFVLICDYVISLHNDNHF